MDVLQITYTGRTDVRLHLWVISSASSDAWVNRSPFIIPLTPVGSSHFDTGCSTLWVPDCGKNGVLMVYHMKLEGWKEYKMAIKMNEPIAHVAVMRCH